MGNSISSIYTEKNNIDSATTNKNEQQGLQAHGKQNLLFTEENSAISSLCYVKTTYENLFDHIKNKNIQSVENYLAYEQSIMKQVADYQISISLDPDIPSYDKTTPEKVCHYWRLAHPDISSSHQSNIKHYLEQNKTPATIQVKRSLLLVLILKEIQPLPPLSFIQKLTNTIDDLTIIPDFNNALDCAMKKNCYCDNNSSNQHAHPMHSMSDHNTQKKHSEIFQYLVEKHPNFLLYQDDFDKAPLDYVKQSDNKVLKRSFDDLLNKINDGANNFSTFDENNETENTQFIPHPLTSKASSF